MYPLLHVGTMTLSSYRLCMTLSFLVGAALLIYANKKAGPPLRLGPFVFLPVYVLSLIGAKLMFVFWPENAAPGAKTLFLWKGGYWYHGGLIGGMLGYVLYHLARRNSVLDALDLAAPFICLGESIGRIGCFLSGCCWGTAALTLPGVVLPKDSSAYLQHLHAGLIAEDATNSFPVHPVQLYMSISLILLFVLLRFAWGKRTVRGETILLFFLSDCFVRFWFEFLRADIAKGVCGLSGTQWFSIFTYFLSFGLLSFLYMRARKEKRGEVLHDEEVFP